MFTDGVTKQPIPKTISLARSAWRRPSPSPPDACRNADRKVLADVLAFQGTAPVADDITLVCVQT